MKKETPDRRGSKRYAVTVDIVWEHDGVRRKGTIGDLSETGCFVLTGEEAAEGTEMDLMIPVGDGMVGRFSAFVVYTVPEIGFGVRFMGNSVDQTRFVREYIMRKDDTGPKG